MYPFGHSHLKEPTVFTQSMSQTSDSSVTHSLISKDDDKEDKAKPSLVNPTITNKFCNSFASLLRSNTCLA